MDAVQWRGRFAPGGWRAQTRGKDIFGVWGYWLRRLRAGGARLLGAYERVSDGAVVVSLNFGSLQPPV